MSELFSAYKKYAQLLNFDVEILHEDFGNITAKISGKSVYEAFKYESGKHIVQRISPTEAKGRRHTSVIAVAVLPVQEEITFALNDRDLDVEPVKLSGPGGMNRNKVMSGVRMKHRPTGMQVVINGRDFHKNKAIAKKVLVSKINEKAKRDSERSYSDNRKSQIKGCNRSDKIRTYNFLESRVTDHRTGKKTTNIKAVMKGQFQLVL